MQIIVITRPDFFEEEAGEILQLFENGLEILHLRKPKSSLDELERLLQKIPRRYYSRIVLHEYFGLAQKYALRGIHLNRRSPEVPEEYAGTVSRSCHSLDEIIRYKSGCNYLFLSPIYDSISKEGYGAAFSGAVLQKACETGLIDKKVYALGGITRKNLSEVCNLGFGGAALLGDIWQRKPDNRKEYLKLLLRF